MYKSYFKTALRGMLKNKLHAFINIAGLSVGMAVTITIALWIWDELSYEKHFEQYDRIGQVIQNVSNNGEVGTWFAVPYPLAEELRTNYGASFKQVALISGHNDNLLSTETKKLVQHGIFAEVAFTEILTLNMVKGKRNAIKDPALILISQSAATTYFGDADPMGQVMEPTALRIPTSRARFSERAVLRFIKLMQAMSSTNPPTMPNSHTYCMRPPSCFCRSRCFLRLRAYHRVGGGPGT